jgi:hypothetical protein
MEELLRPKAYGGDGFIQQECWSGSRFFWYSCSSGTICFSSTQGLEDRCSQVSPCPACLPKPQSWYPTASFHFKGVSKFLLLNMFSTELLSLHTSPHPKCGPPPEFLSLFMASSLHLCETETWVSSLTLTSLSPPSADQHQILLLWPPK